MEGALYSHPSVQQQEDSMTTPEDAADSGDEMTMSNAPSPKKSRRSMQKRVVTVPIGEVDGSRKKAGEVCPPSDSWTWRKYGQKPIKGSPYPRGYYRCSSSKGCPARKQVERSRVDPTLLLITYASDHNHPPLPTTKHRHSAAPTAVPAKFPPEELAVFANQPDLEPENSSFADLAGEFGWFSDLASTALDGPVFVGPACVDADVAIMLPIGEEDEALFADLGELPECSFVFRRCSVETPCCGSTG